VARAPTGKARLPDDVVRLLAAGRTNAQIGAELYISPKTASVHVTSILRKLGPPAGYRPRPWPNGPTCCRPATSDGLLTGEHCGQKLFRPETLPRTEGLWFGGAFTSGSCEIGPRLGGRSPFLGWKVLG
jgi:Bacterial regulatory proteins, luxR family